MPVDYDLAIVGGTLTGRWSALRAAQMGARVVLIEPPDLGLEGNSAVELTPLNEPGPDLPLTLTVSGLAANGVDVRLAPLSFLGMQPICLQVGTHRLTARKALLALAGEPCRYDITGIAACQPSSLTALATDPWPKQMALVGEQAATIEAAVVLTQRGVAVTLVLPNQRILPAEDVDVQRLVTVQLQALGVTWGASPCFSKTEGQIWLKTASASASYPVDRVVLTDTAPPERSHLQLSGLNAQGPLAVNAYLQTQLPGLYAVGPVLGGEDRLTLAQSEAAAAVENALFWPRHAVRYDRIHYSLRVLTPIGRAGLTEQQARRYYQAVVTYQSGAEGRCDTAEAASVYAVDFCKLVVAEERLVGLHLMGVGSEVAIALLAPYLGHSPTRLIKALTDLTISHGLATQLQQVLAHYRSNQWQPGTWRRDWAENWFNWRRSR